MTRSSIVAAAVSLIAAIAASAAAASSGVIPEKGVASPGTTVNTDGVYVPGAGDRYVALGQYGDTTIARVEQDGGRVTKSRGTGSMSLPAVAEDGSGAGLSADGKTLVLAEPRLSFPQPSSRFWILDASSLRTTDQLTLKGDFSFDAISPDGSRLYFIEHTSPGDPSQYDVRAFATQSGGLLPHPVIDPDEPGEDMQGTPVTRAMSPDGRWAYTLYEGYRGNESFVHALDTENGSAVCVDLDSLSGLKTLSGFALEVGAGGSRLSVLDQGGSAQASIDTDSFEVSAPSTHGAPAADSGGGSRWQLAVAGIAILVIAASLAFGLARASRRHRTSPSEPDWGPANPRRSS